MWDSNPHLPAPEDTGVLPLNLISSVMIIYYTSYFDCYHGTQKIYRRSNGTLVEVLSFTIYTIGYIR